MPTSLEKLPVAEMMRRLERCRTLAASMIPQAGGLLICSRPNIYYLTGTLALGLLWIPMNGSPVLMVRKGLERAKLESPCTNIASFRSYRDIVGICSDFGSPLTPVIAVDKNGFTWSMSEMLQGRVADTSFLACDGVLSRAKAVKSEWELNKMRLCGSRHRRALEELIPERIHPGMTELEIAETALKIFLECGSSGMIRMNAHGEENYAGYVSAGDSGNYPTYYDGPLGCRGLHPAMPFLGDAGTVWHENQPLTTDLGFSVEGYTTDRTLVYWAEGVAMPDVLRRAQDACMRVMEETAAALKPGAIPFEIWERAQAIAAEEGFADVFMGAGKDRVAFLGHGIGLAMDEFPVFAKGFMEPLEQGMTVAIEPKIGVPGLGMMGVEHTFEITADGALSLTGDLRDVCFVG
ncbi:MAG: M24 family metallopeptidase [Desulfovibrionaceae bacterium]|nr:M24 family metallopeptidase [Desulfovibrionaceae bacterium]